jgi:hypothetical protein
MTPTVNRLIPSRACSRCRKELTVPISIQTGIGPECRAKANEILDKQHPTAWNEARVAAAFILLQCPEGMPEDFQTVFQRVSAAILQSKGMNGTDQEVGISWRQTVEDLAFLASFKISETARLNMLEIIKGLGYETYAAYLAKEASASEGKIWIGTDNRLYFQAVRNAAGRRALAANVKGLHAVDDADGFKWIAPLTSGAAMLEAIKRYWPFTDVSAVEVVIQAIVQTAPDAAKPEPKPVFIRKEGTSIIIPGAPILKYEPEFVSALKDSIKFWPERFWDGKNRNWKIYIGHEDLVKTLLAKHYPEVKFQFI